MLSLSAGSLVQYQGDSYRVVRPRDLDTLIVETPETGRLRDVPIEHLTVPGASAEPPVSISVISDEEREEAEHRFKLIAPLLGLHPRPRSAVEARAKEVNSSPSTLYRILADYEESGNLSGLTRRPRSDAGQTRMSPEVLELTKEVVNDVYLKKDQHSLKYAHETLVSLCKDKNLPSPSRDTLRRHIQRISPKKRARRRRGANAAQELELSQGSFPGANAPWDVVQIDHTPLDLLVVSEDGREVAGRPFLTVAICVYSRVVLGFYLSMDAPSYFSAGACLSHAMLPKDTYLAGHQKRLAEILQEALKDHEEVTRVMPELRWSVWGKPTKIHADNAREFRGKMLERSCQAHGIHVELRPVKKPWYGGHIESLMGTVAKEIHNVPGTTFSNPKRRGEYKSEKKAALTFEEIELWLTIFFAAIYNQRPHRGLNGQIPMEVYQRAMIEGTPHSPPKPWSRPTAEEALKLRIDFLPSFPVTIQRNGITLDTVTYYHEVLEPYRARRKPGQPSERFYVRRDPRLISPVYFYAEDVGRYFAIPFARPEHERKSIWELRRLKEQVPKKSGSHVKEDDLLRAEQSRRAIVSHGQQETTKTRRETEKKRQHNKVEPYLEPELSSRSPIPDDDDNVVIIPLPVHH